MKSVLFVAHSARGLFNLRFELIKELLNNGFIVYFSVPEKEDDTNVTRLIKLGAYYERININRRSSNPIYDISLIIDLYQVVKKLKPSIVLTYNIKANIYGSIVSNCLNIPCFMNVTGIGTALTYSKLKYLVSKLYKYACYASDLVFFQNSSNYDLFIEKSICNDDKVILLPGSGVNIEKFVPIKTKTIQNQTTFLFIGRVMKEKGIEEFIESANKISKKYKNIKFQILGSFEDENYRIVINNNPNIEYLGYSHDVREQIKEVDCIIQPSYHEGMSNVLLESGAMAKPLIASDIPGCKEIIEEGYNGYLFEAKNTNNLYLKIEKFLSLEESKKKEMGQNSRQKMIDEFDRKIIVDTYFEEVNKIIKGQRK